MEKEGNKILNINPTIVDSVERALTQNNVPTNIATISNKLSSVSGKLDTMISLLQQLVEK